MSIPEMPITMEAVIGIQHYHHAIISYLLCDFLNARNTPAKPRIIAVPYTSTLFPFSSAVLTGPDGAGVVFGT